MISGFGTQAFSTLELFSIILMQDYLLRTMVTEVLKIFDELSAFLSINEAQRTYVHSLEFYGFFGKPFSENL